jgi:hypothetical protein
MEFSHRQYWQNILIFYPCANVDEFINHATLPESSAFYWSEKKDQWEIDAMKKVIKKPAVFSLPG